ncbi:hypothetical protein JXQ70_12125 [bacterium]|nr:hypothetical protein [bacterium]
MLLLMGKYGQLPGEIQTEEWSLFYHFFLPFGFLVQSLWRKYLRSCLESKDISPGFSFLSYLPAAFLVLLPIHHTAIISYDWDHQLHGLCFVCSVLLGLVDCMVILLLRAKKSALLNQHFSVRNVSVLVFGSVLVFYAILAPYLSTYQHLTGDEPHYLMMIQSLISDHDLNLKNNYENRDYSGFYQGQLSPQPTDTVNAHEIRSYHSPLLALLLLPGYMLAGHLGTIWSMNFFTAVLTGLVFLYLGPRLGNETALLTCFIFSTTIPFSQYAFRIFPEVPAALVSFLAFVLLSSGIKHRARVALIMVLITILMMLKLRYTPVAVALFFFSLANTKRPGRRIVLMFLGLVIIISGIAAIIAFFDEPTFLYRHTHILADFHKIMIRWDITSLTAALGIIMDQEYGLLLYCPLYVIALVLPLLNGTLRTQISARHQLTWLLVTSIFYVCLVIKLKSLTWHGGWAPPLRFLVVILPFWLPLLAELFRLKSTFLKAILIVLGSYSVLVSNLVLVIPSLAFNRLDGSARWLEYLGQKILFNIHSLFPSLVRPNIALYPWFFSLIIFLAVISLRAISIHSETRPAPLKPRQSSPLKVLIPLTLSVIILAGLIALLVFRPTFTLEAEDKMDFHARKGHFFPLAHKEEHLRKPLFRCGWELNVNGDILAYFRTITSSNLMVIWAKGTPSLNIWPLMSVTIDEQPVGQYSIVSDQIMPFPHEYKKIARKIQKESDVAHLRWISAEFPVDLKPGLHLLTISFINDYYDSQNADDRNLIIDKVEIRPILSWAKHHWPIKLFPHFLYGEIH